VLARANERPCELPPPDRWWMTGASPADGAPKPRDKDTRPTRHGEGQAYDGASSTAAEIRRAYRLYLPPAVGSRFFANSPVMLTSSSRASSHLLRLLMLPRMTLILATARNIGVGAIHPVGVGSIASVIARSAAASLYSACSDEKQADSKSSASRPRSSVFARGNLTHLAQQQLLPRRLVRCACRDWASRRLLARRNVVVRSKNAERRSGAPYAAELSIAGTLPEAGASSKAHSTTCRCQQAAAVGSVSRKALAGRHWRMSRSPWNFATTIL
jgi:hypothetical protein